MNLTRIIHIKSSMSLILKRQPHYLRNLIFKLWLRDAQYKIRRIGKYLSCNEKLLDIGAGSGSVCLLLMRLGYNITALDVRDRSLTEEVNPSIYDGDKLPYEDGYFDTALILTVLHHTYDPRNILLEAKRVAGKIIILEDVYQNIFQKYLTYTVDSILNLEIFDHPHNNKNDREWKKLFRELNLSLKDSKQERFLFFFRQAVYYLEK